MVLLMLRKSSRDSIVGGLCIPCVSMKGTTMADPRIEKWAEVLTGYCVDVRPGETVAISGGVAAEPLLRAVRDGLVGLDSWTDATAQGVVDGVAAAAGVGLGKVAQPLRVALTGDVASPGIGVTLWLVGRERVVARIDRALEIIRSRG